jgi:hypothetical protein
MWYFPEINNTLSLPPQKNIYSVMSFIYSKLIRKKLMILLLYEADRCSDCAFFPDDLQVFNF